MSETNEDLMQVMQVVQESGETNMLTRQGVARVAGELGYFRCASELGMMTSKRYDELLQAFSTWLSTQEDESDG